MNDVAAQIFVLIFYLWNPDVRTSNPIGSAEFSSWQRCEDAARQAADKFGGALGKPYHICVPK